MKKPMLPFLHPLPTHFLFLRKKAYLWTLFAAFCFISCEEAELIPFAGTYTGNTTTEKWGFEEIFDTDGNMVGIKQTRDTVITEGDMFTVTQDGKNSTFTISGSGGLTRLNSYSTREFSYENQQAFSLVEQTDGVETLRLEFSFDGTGNASLMFLSNTPDNNNNRPPIGEQYIFSGVGN